MPVSFRIRLAIFIAAFLFLGGWGFSAVAAVSQLGTPRGAAIDEGLNQLYLIDEAKNRLLILDPESFDSIGEVMLPGRPSRIEVYEPTHEVFVSSFFGKSVFIFDGAALGRGGQDAVLPKNTLAVEGNPLLIKVLPALNALFIFDNTANKVYIHDLSSKQLRQTLAFSDEINAWEFDEGLNKLYLSSVHEPLLYVVNFPAAGKPSISRLRPSATVYQLAVDSQRHILLANALNDKTIVWDTATDRELAVIDAGRTANSFPECSDKLAKCYLPNFWSHSITVFDTGQRRIKQTIHLEESAHPSSVIIDEAREKIYVFAGGSWRLVVLDGRTDEVLKEIQTGIGGGGTALNTKTGVLFVPNRESGTLTVVKGNDLSSQTMPELARGKYYAPDPDNALAHPGPAATYSRERKLYLVDLGGALQVLNMDSYRLLKTLPVGERIRSMTIDTRNKRLYAVSDMEHTLYVVDIENDRITSRIKLLEDEARPDREYAILDLNAAPQFLFIADFHHDDILIFDKNRNEVVRRLKGFDHINRAASDASKKEIYLLSFLDGKVSVLDAETFEKKREFILPRPSYASHFIFDAKNDRIYYAKGSRVYVIDPEDGKVVKSILLQHRSVTGIVLATGFRRLYVGAHYGVDVIDTEKNEVVAAFDVENHHNSFVYNPNIGVVYAYNNEVTASDGYAYAFDVAGDKMLSTMPVRQIIPKYAHPAIDMLSNTLFIPESYARQLLRLAFDEQTTKVIESEPLSATRLRFLYWALGLAAVLDGGVILYRRRRTAMPVNIK